MPNGEDTLGRTVLPRVANGAVKRRHTHHIGERVAQDRCNEVPCHTLQQSMALSALLSLCRCDSSQDASRRRTSTQKYERAVPAKHGRVHCLECGLQDGCPQVVLPLAVQYRPAVHVAHAVDVGCASAQEAYRRKVRFGAPHRISAGTRHAPNPKKSGQPSTMAAWLKLASSSSGAHSARNTSSSAIGACAGYDKVLCLSAA